MTTERRANVDMTDFQSRINGTLTRMSVGHPWDSFLTRGADQDKPLIIDEAKKRDSVDHPRHHIQVISRATLLLRVATGMSARLLRSSGLTKDQLKFWWNNLGVDHGLWESGDAIDDFEIMWADVTASIDDAKDWDSGSLGKSIQSWLEEQPETILSLSGCERIALWGLF